MVFRIYRASTGRWEENHANPPCKNAVAAFDEFNDPMWTLEIKEARELLDLSLELGQELIIKPEELPVIVIYDDYIE